MTDTRRTAQSKSYLFVKRSLDVAGSLLGLLLFAPVMLGAAVCIYLDMGLPLLFRQQRTGIGGKLFAISKFRSMREGAGLPDADRLSRAGALLRGLSIDELPQLWNVLRGEMSLVGPRPLLPEYLPLYSDYQRRRHDVKPGITGWAQVSGRNTLGWEEKFELDVWYVDHASSRLDVAILCKTVGKVLRRDGISEMGHATATKFCGSSMVPALGSALGSSMVPALGSSIVPALGSSIVPALGSAMVPAMSSAMGSARDGERLS